MITVNFISANRIADLFRAIKKYFFLYKTVLVFSLSFLIGFLVSAQQNIDSIQTFLGGRLSAALRKPVLNNDSAETEPLLTADNNVINGTTIESDKKLLVSVSGMYMFKYSLNPASLSLTDCGKPPQNICYDCLYDLTIVITDDFNNQHMPGRKPYIILRRNFSIAKPNTNCKGAQSFDVQDSLLLEKGSYNINKRLSISAEALNYYRDSVLMKNNVCQSFYDVLKQQQQIIYNRIINWNQPDSAFEIIDYRGQMLKDMIPLTGQYADTSAGSKNSIFSISEDRELNYHFPATPYLDKKGNPDSVKLYRNSVPVTVIPDSLGRNEFITYFKNSWLNSLLPLHPEYCLLQQYESIKDNDKWNRAFQETETYADAFAKGYLNPTGNKTISLAKQFIINQTDPLYNSVFGNEAKVALEDSLFNYCKSNNMAIFPNVSLWSVATIAAKCNDNADSASTIISPCTFFYSNLANVFNTDSLCAGDLDEAWRIFRNAYLNEKAKWIDKRMRQDCGNPVIKQPYVAVFPGMDDLFVQNSKSASYKELQVTSAVAKTLNKFYTDNCNAYVNRWWLQLAPCNYTKEDSVIVIPRLLAVCREGSSVNRPFGSSSLSPASTNKYKSFEDVINQYNDSAYNGQKNIAQCSSYLVDRPLPYQSSIVLTNTPVNTKPGNCECAQISQLFAEYNADTSQRQSFNLYLHDKYHTDISQASLDILLGLCNNTAKCKYISTPIELPALLQCSTGDICREGSIVKSVYDSFIVKFHSIVPARIETNDNQQKINRLFANYMNQQLGFHKSYAEYLDFLDTCKKFNEAIQTDTSGLITGSTKLLQLPLLCETNESLEQSFINTTENTDTDSTSLPFIKATEIYRSYIEWLGRIFKDRYIEKCLGASQLESFIVKHPVASH